MSHDGHAMCRPHGLGVGLDIWATKERLESGFVYLTRMAVLEKHTRIVQISSVFSSRRIAEISHGRVDLLIVI